MNNNNEKKNEIVEAVLEAKIIPSFPKERLSSRSMVKVPLVELATGCAAFASLSDTFRTVTQTISIPVDGLFRFDSRGYTGIVSQLKDGGGQLTGIYQPGVGLIGNGAYLPAEGIEGVMKTAIPFDPVTLAIAVALASINKKLDAIQETQEEILEFLKEEKRAAIRGNIIVLNDIMSGLKHNAGNETWIGDRRKKVLDIMQESEKDIEFFRAQIERLVDRKSLINGDIKTAKKSDRLIDYLSQYQASLHMLGFSMFLDVLLGQNFKRSYLQILTGKLEQYGIDFRMLYTKAYNQIAEQSASSVEGLALRGLSFASKAAGGAIAKIPLVEKGRIDEALIDAGGTLGEVNDKRKQKAIDGIIGRSDNCALPFMSNIKLLDRLYNQATIYYLDNDTLYCDTEDRALPEAG